MSTISHVTLYQNGLVLTRDAAGQLLRPYCGPRSRVGLAIICDAPPACTFLKARRLAGMADGPLHRKHPEGRLIDIGRGGFWRADCRPDCSTPLTAAAERLLEETN